MFIYIAQSGSDAHSPRKIIIHSQMSLWLCCLVELSYVCVCAAVAALTCCTVMLYSCRLLAVALQYALW